MPPNEKAKAIYSGLAVVRELAIIACVLAETERQAGQGGGRKHTADEGKAQVWPAWRLWAWGSCRWPN